MTLMLLCICLAFLASGMVNVSTVTLEPWFPGSTYKPMPHHKAKMIMIFRKLGSLFSSCTKQHVLQGVQTSTCFPSFAYLTQIPYFSHGQTLTQNGVYCSNDCAHLICKFLDGDAMVLYDLAISAC